MRKHIVNQLMDITIEINDDRVNVTGYIRPALIASLFLIGLFACYLIAR